MTGRLPLVLVHGGAHGAWCWEPIRPLLPASTLAVDLPPTVIRGAPHVEPPPEIATLGLADFADAVLAATDQARLTRFVLVGHSMGGLTIAEVARQVPDRVAHLVFVSCLVPPEGKSSIDALPAALRDLATDGVGAAGPGAPPAGALDEATIRRLFCNDMDEHQTAFVLAHCGSEVAALLGERVSRRGIPPELPKTYVRLARDQSLPPLDQDAQIAALRASPGGPLDVVDLDAGHDVMISAPARLAPVLDRIAG